MSKDALELSFLVLRAQAGSDEAFTSLFERFGPGTESYLAGLVGEASAKDVQQEVWITVYRRLADLADPAAFKSWLFRIARHRAIDRLRKSKREDEMLEEAATEMNAGSLEPHGFQPPSASDPDVLAALGRLLPIHREVIVLRYWEEMTYGEIALVTGTPIGTVRSRIHHAKKQLKSELEYSPNQEVEDE